MKKNIGLKTILLFSLFVCSCATTQKEWNKNARNITADMKRQKKDAMLFFTGSDWDIKSKEIFDIVNSQEFIEKYRKTFIMYNIDIVKNEELMPAAELKNSYILFAEYKVDDLPYLAMKNPDGDVYFSQNINPDKAALKNLKEIIEEALTRREKLNEIKKEIRKSLGAEKTAAIDRFFKFVYNPEDPRYNSLREEAVQSDPENKSGLKGKFIFFIARLEADKLSARKKYIEAAAEFEKAVSSGFLEAEAEQVAWYNIAYLYTMSKQIKSEKIIECLNKAIEANPSSEAVNNFKNIIEELKNKK